MSQKYSPKRNRMRKKNDRVIPAMLIGIGGLVLLVLAAMALINRQSAVKIEVSGAPSVRVDKEMVDLGDVKLGKTVEVTFKVSNAGDQPLRLSELPYIEVVEGC